MNSTYIFLALICLFSSCIQGITGFGISLVAFPILVLFLPAGVITPMLVLVSIIISFMIFRSVKINNFKEFRPILICAALSTPLGALFLKFSDSAILNIIAGLLISITSITMLGGHHFNFRRLGLVKTVVGILSGFFNGSLSMSGPPVIFYMSNNGESKNSLRGNFSIYSFILNLFTGLSLLFSGMLTSEVFTCFLVALPSILIGSAVGIRISKYINEHIFRKIVLIFLLLMGLSTLTFAII